MKSNDLVRVFLGLSAVVALSVLAGCSNPALPAVTQPTITSSGEDAAYTVSINNSASGSTIYYTTDGSTPTSSSTKYSGPFGLEVTKVGSPMTVKAIAVESGMSSSPVATALVGLGQTLNLSGTVTTLAGSTASSPFAYPQGVTTDGANLYVADTNGCRIYKVDIATGTVTTLAGSGTCASADGTGTSAEFYNPYGITTDGTNLYVADTGGSSPAIRKVVIATGKVTTVATVNTSVFGMTIVGTNLYFTEVNNNLVAKLDLLTNTVTTFATTGTGPYGITSDGTSLYVADNGNSTAGVPGEIQKIVIATKVVSTVAPGLADAGGITTDGTNLYVIGGITNAVFDKVSIATGTVTTLTTSGGSFSYPHDIVTDGVNLYVADTSNYQIKEIQ